MKIAVTYDNGNVFQHFGKTENFKVYEVEDDKVVSSEVIGSNGTGHGALAGLLAEQGINVLICGGIGGGAQTALTEAGIEMVAGAQGNTDDVVEAYLKGELVSTGANCDHHHHEEGHSCGSHEEGHSCGGSCGGCGGHKSDITGPNVGKTCRTHYKGTFNDGTQFDSSYDRGEPLEFIMRVVPPAHVEELFHDPAREVFEDRRDDRTEDECQHRVTETAVQTVEHEQCAVAVDGAEKTVEKTSLFAQVPLGNRTVQHFAAPAEGAVGNVEQEQLAETDEVAGEEQSLQSGHEGSPFLFRMDYRERSVTPSRPAR